MILDGYADLIEVVGEASDAEGAVEQAKATAVDLVLMDAHLANGVDATRQIRQILPQVVILGLSAEYTPYLYNAMIAAGAVAFVRMEDAGVMLRIDPTVTPTMAKTPTLAMAIRARFIVYLP